MSDKRENIFSDADVIYSYIREQAIMPTFVSSIRADL